MTQSRTLVLAVLAFLLVHPSMLHTQTKNIEAMKWLVGVWQIATPNGTIVETWQISNDSTLVGKGSFVKSNNEIVPQETLEMAFRNGAWYYTSAVQNQNNQQPVRFKVIFHKGTEFISENPEHDFPQRIAYRRLKQNLFASIEGKKGGRYGKENYDFTAK